MSKYYIGIDQGTTLTTAVLVDEDWNVIAKASKPHRQFYPQPGWVEQDPQETYLNCLLVVKKVLESAPDVQPKDIKGLGLDHQGETCTVWEKSTGKPIYNAIVWQDRRTSQMADALNESHGEEIKKITGLVPDAYFSATKISWILDNVECARERADRGELLAGTLNTYLFWRFTGGRSFETDISSAASMMLMDIRTTDWAPEILAYCNVPRSILPDIVDTNHFYGETDPNCFMGLKVSIGGCLADSPAALIGSGCAGEGIVKTSYGTGSFMHFQTGSRIVTSTKGLFTRTCWRIDGKPNYLLSASSYVAGGAISWLKDGLHIIDSPEETEVLAKSVDNSNGVYFVPAFAGLASPFWDQYARGLFIGLTSGVTREHLVRSVLESLAYQVTVNYRAMRDEFGKDSPGMIADGGMVDNGFLMQFQADMLGIPVKVPAEKETSAYGSACLAGYTMGSLPSLEAPKEFVKIKKVYEPRMMDSERDERISRWLDAVERSRNWEKH